MRKPSRYDQAKEDKVKWDGKPYRSFLLVIWNVRYADRPVMDPREITVRCTIGDRITYSDPDGQVFEIEIRP